MPQRELILSAAPLVAYHARRYSRGRRTDLDLDLVQEGWLGAIRAAQGFKEAKGVQFATYAQWWIKAYITRYAAKRRRTEGLGDAPWIAQEVATPEQALLASETAAEVRAALTTADLGARGTDIITQRLSSDDPATLTSLAASWGVSREIAARWDRRVRARLTDALRPCLGE